jgi:cell wall-associated NlpC family hydrolase
MTARLIAALIVTALLAACGRGGAAPAPATEAAASTPAESAAPAADAPISLSPDDIARLGLAVAPARPTHVREEVRGYYQVLNHDLLAPLVGEAAQTEAASVQSRAALARLEALAVTPGAYSAESLEGARRQAAADTAAHEVAERRLTALLGTPPKAAGNLADWASGRSLLVRLTFPFASGVDKTPHRVRLAPDGAALPHHTPSSSSVWPAPADPAVPGNGYWASIKDASLIEGSRGTAWAAVGAELHGVRVPESAIVIHDGSAWCFIEEPKGSFSRVSVDTTHPVDGGYVVTREIKPGAALVVHGAGLLLARASGAAADDAP